jgi:hypothetical protein
METMNLADHVRTARDRIFELVRSLEVDREYQAKLMAPVELWRHLHWSFNYGSLKAVNFGLDRLITDNEIIKVNENTNKA